MLRLWDSYPVSPGHALPVTRRYVTDWFAASPEEPRALSEAIELGSWRRTLRTDSTPASTVGEAGGSLPDTID